MPLLDTIRVKLSSEAAEYVSITPVVVQEMPVRDLVEHMILSHHGSLEFGSPKVPMFLEAMLLHQIDNLDSKMETMRAHSAKDRQATGVWTGYSAPLERIVLKKHQYLDGEPFRPACD